MIMIEKRAQGNIGASQVAPKESPANAGDTREMGMIVDGEDP